MATRIKLKRSTTAATVPTTSNLEDGEVALNIADRKLYARNGANIIEVANQKPNTGEVVTTMFATDITNGQGNTYYVATVGTDNNTLANGGDNGKHPDTPFLTVAKALSVASSGDTVLIAPGDYQETFPLTVPDGVTVRGTNLRSTQIRPTSGTNDLNAFVLQGDSQVSDLTIKDFFYNSGNDTGYGFVCASSLSSDKSPYIERVTVLTKGSVTSASDPYGFSQGDAGRGAKLDGAVFNSNSIESAVLFNEVTFIVPNAVGLFLTNGVRVEWLNSFVYFASEGIKGVQGATGRYGTGNTRLKLGGVSGTFSTSEVAYQLEDSFQSGTYARSGTTVTVTRTAHGLTTNDYIYADHISGSANDGFYQVTVSNANSFTYTDTSSGTTSGNVTYKKAVARGTVASNDGTYVFITGKGTGEFTTVTKQSKTTSRFGDTQLDTAQQKFGTASILFDGTEDQLTVPTSDDFGFGTSNFAFECFIRPNGGSGTQRIFDFRDASATDTAPTLYLSGTSPYTLNYAVGNGAAQSGGSLATGTWYHIAAARSGGTTRIFVDGTQVASFTDTNDYGSTKPLAIGANFNTTAPTEEFTGHIDEVRVSKGAGRFTGAFTPTTSEYSTDLNTVLLLHANGTDALTTFDDASGGISDVRSSGGDSATSVITADYSQFGAELRSISSANIYGTKGAVADGAGVKLLLTSHNFAYIGADADFSNDPSLAVQANEVTELNGGKIFYSATNEKGDFRVGDAFVVDQSTGNVQFQATSQAQSAANITLSDGTGTTNIYPAYIETGNLRLAGNSLTSTTGQVIVDPAGQEDFVVNAETIVKEAIYFDVNKSIAFGSTVQGALKISGFNGSTVFGSSEASNFSTRSFVVLKNGIGGASITSAGTGYVGGSQPTDVTTNPYTLATATVALNAEGSVKRVNLTNRGSGYTFTPTLAFTTGTAIASASLGNGGIIQNISVISGGTNYSAATTTIDIAPPPQNSFVAETPGAVNTSTNEINLPSHNFETGFAFVFDSSTLDATAVAPSPLVDGTTYYAIRVDNDHVKVASSLANANAGTAISLTTTGSGTSFFQGIQATATPVISGGVITGVTVNNGGTGYQSVVPQVVDSGSGNGATVVAEVGFSIGDITISGGGTYTSAPGLTITRDPQDTTGSGAAGTPILGFPLETVTLTNQGLGYRNIPTVSTDGDDDATTPGTLTAVLDEKTGRISSITVDAEGEGYETTPNVSIVGGGGENAQLTIDIQALTGSITASGSGYTPGTYSNVSWTGSNSGIGATATFVVPGLSGSITNAGSGYTDAVYGATLYNNVVTTTYTLTVVQRGQLEFSNGSGTFQVGETVTGSTSGVTATITAIAGTTLYVNNASGDFLDAQQDTITGGTSGATGDVDLWNASLGRFLINGVEAQDLNLIEDNTYRFTNSDASNANHPPALAVTPPDVTTRQVGTPGSAGAFFEVVVGPGVASGGAASTYLNCTNHGQSMIEPGVINWTTGAAGQGGSGMNANITVSGGQVTAVEITAQGTGIAINDVLYAEPADIGGTGSGFTYTIQSNNTGITSVTGLSLTGSGYAIGEVLSVDDATVGGGGGSGFQYTVSNVGFATAVTVSEPGNAYELADTVVVGDVGGAGTDQGTGLEISIDSISATKSMELTQQGVMTLGESGSDQLSLNPSGLISAGTWNISTTGAASFTAGAFGGALTAAEATVNGTFAASGAATFSGGVTVSGGTGSTIANLTASIADGAAATPSLNFENSTTTGLFRETNDVIGISVAATQIGKVDSSGLFINGLSIDSGINPYATDPFFKVETATPKLTVGAAAANITIDNTNTIGTDGTDIDVPLNFDTKNGGNFVFKGGTNVDFSIEDGASNETFNINTLTGDITASGNLDAGILRLRDNVIQNNSTSATRSFGEVLGLTVTGSGSGYTDGTYTATATTTNGSGTGLTVTVTVSGGDFTTVAVVDKGQNYAVGDEITITAAGSGIGRSVNVSDIDGQGVVLKPSAGKDVLISTTGALVIPAGTTNERPNVLDRLPGAIRYNTTQLQFEGYNGTDFVSLGGVRDVDQDTYILTESAPGVDEDTFEFYNAGLNSLAIDKDKFRLKTTRLMEVEGVLNIDGVTLGQNTVDFKSLGASVVQVRSKKDLEVTGGIRLRAVAQQGVAATLDATSITSTAGAYTPSLSTSGTTTFANLEGTGCTVDISVDGSGNISVITINSGGTTYEVGEVLKILGTELGAASPENDVTVEVASISGAAAAFTRVDLLNPDYVTRMNSKPFISYDSNGPQAGFKINRGWNAGTQSYLTVMDSTADFVELDDCRVEGGQLTTFPTSATITAFDKSQYKGAKVLVAIESNDGKVHMLEVTVVCAAAGTDAHATVTNSVTSDNDLVDASVAVVGSNVNISLAKSSAATSSTSFTGRFTTTKVKV